MHGIIMHNHFNKIGKPQFSVAVMPLYLPIDKKYTIISFNVDDLLYMQAHTKIPLSIPRVHIADDDICSYSIILFNFTGQYPLPFCY